MRLFVLLAIGGELIFGRAQIPLGLQQAFALHLRQIRPAIARQCANAILENPLLGFHHDAFLIHAAERGIERRPVGPDPA